MRIPKRYTRMRVRELCSIERGLRTTTHCAYGLSMLYTSAYMGVCIYGLRRGRRGRLWRWLRTYDVEGEVRGEKGSTGESIQLRRWAQLVFDVDPSLHLLSSFFFFFFLFFYVLYTSYANPCEGGRGTEPLIYQHNSPCWLRRGEIFRIRKICDSAGFQREGFLSFSLFLRCFHHSGFAGRKKFHSRKVIYARPEDVRGKGKKPRSNRLL